MSGFTARSIPAYGKTDMPVLFEPCGKMVVIRDVKHRLFVGLLDSTTAKAIKGLLDLRKTTIQAYVLQNGTISVTVYGLQTDAEVIAAVLSENHYFLQQPDSFESATVYRNPQWLGETNRSNTTDWVDLVANDYQTTTLTSEAKSLVMTLIDSACGPADFRQVQISDKLLTSLKRYV